MMTNRNLDSRGSALPAALFLAAMLALVGAALHLAVQTEQRLAVNCMESDRARLAAVSALHSRTAQLRQALARFRLPGGLTDADAERYLDDFLSGEQGRCLSLLEDGVPSLETRFGPWTLDLPLDGARMTLLGALACCRAACHLEPAGVSGSPATGLSFTYRCRVTGEGRSNSPGRERAGAAFCREDSRFTIILARFPCCHWQLCLPAGGDESGSPRLHLPPLHFTGPVRTWGPPGFAGTGLPRSGLPRFHTVFLTSRDDRACWSLASSADPQFAGGGLPCRLERPAPLGPPGNLARASLGLSPGPGPILGADELLQALGLPAGTGRPPPGIYLLRDGELTGGIYVEGDLALLEIRGEGEQQILLLEPAAGPPRLEVRVDRRQQTTWIDSVPHPGLLQGPLYVEGSIHSLGTGAGGSGPVPPAMAPGAELTVASSGVMVVRDHLVYTASPGPFPDPRTLPPADGRVLGLFSAGCRADGSAAGGLGIVLQGPPQGRLRLDAVLAVGGEGRGVCLAGDGQASGAVLFGALTVDSLVQPQLLSRLTVTYDPRLAGTAFGPPGWPAGSTFEAYLASWEVRRREEISPYH